MFSFLEDKKPKYPELRMIIIKDISFKAKIFHILNEAAKEKIDIKEEYLQN